MFDPKQVDLDKEPTFFIEIKNQVQSVTKDWGKIDHVYVEQVSKGNVWVRFGGGHEQATQSATKTIAELDKRQFDGRELAVSFVGESEFITQLMK